MAGGVYDDPSSYPLAGTSETSEEPFHAAAAGGPMSRLAGCLSILESIRMPTLPGTGSATQAGSAAAAGSATGAGGVAGAASSAGPGPASLSHAVSGGAAGAAAGGSTGGGGGRSRRLVGKLEPGVSMRRRDMSMSVMDVREAWDECAECRPLCMSAPGEGGADGPASPSSSGRPFMVRGQDYMKTKLKVPARGAIYRLLAADVVSGDTKLTHVAKMVNMGALHRMACGVGAGTAASVTAPQVDPHLPPLLIITIMLPLYPATLFGGNDGPSQSLVYYFALPPGFNPATFENQTALGLLRRFVTNGREADGSPTRDRLKLIPRVVNVDEWAAKGPLSPAEHKLLATYNDKPILTRPQHFFYSGPGYLEVDIDIHSYQFLARKAFSAYFNRLQSVIFENAFVIQGNSPEELPEQVLGAVRMYRLDMMRPRPVREFLQPPVVPGGVALAAAPAAAAAARLAGLASANSSNAPPLGAAAAAAAGVAEAVEEEAEDASRGL
ncbi:hypothetical protein HXX76_002145 [Chlamydomonas incerta]|uniref:Protein ENHANCED DISEASE RESISTANCE 2 C-terminal domain-containing protein n=1 Tax=Chlamydomonas incerta TaxID=51695 RepID=A0A835WAI9_CHLIN|nr:hypothetical protein HXX76_002145 [Chlamydomonas incerta]|eukprot:KAG2443802.1 hypothetical protein HXX76_002145 [Chlamydomonas incerta]